MPSRTLRSTFSVKGCIYHSFAGNFRSHFPIRGKNDKFLLALVLENFQTCFEQNLVQHCRASSTLATHFFFTLVKHDTVHLRTEQQLTLQITIHTKQLCIII